MDSTQHTKVAKRIARQFSFSKGNIETRIALCFVMVLCVACNQHTFNSEAELWAFVRNTDNGYHYEKKVGSVSYSLTYRPTDVLVKQELGNSYTERDVDSLRKKYQQYLYFNLSMSNNGRELLNSKARNRNDFGAMVNQLAFGMADKVHLISQKRDTIPVVDYVYPRMYGMSNSTSLLFVYPKDQKLFSGEFFHITVEDLGLATGEVGFKIPIKKLQQEPRLRFKNTL